MFRRTDKPPHPGFEWARLNGEFPVAELDRIDDACSRPTDEQGGLAADAIAQEGMGLAFVPVLMRTVWGRVTGYYTGEGSGQPLYTWTPIVTSDNAHAEQDPDAAPGVALEANFNAAVPTDGSVVVPFWPSEDALEGGQGEKWRFVYLGSQGYATDIGDGTSTTITVTHNLNTTELVPVVIEVSTGQVVYPTVTFTSPTTATVTFLTAPSSGQYRLLLTRPSGGTPTVTGPSGGSTDTAIAIYDGTTGFRLKDSVVTIGPTGVMTGTPTIQGGTAAAGTLTLTGTTNTTSPGTTIALQTSGDTNTTRTILDVRHATTATAAAGLGSTIALSVENASGAMVQAAGVDAVWADATAGSEDASFKVRLAAAGTLTEAFEVISPGVVRTPEVAAPAAPAAGFGYWYFGTDNRPHAVGDDGTDYDLANPATEGTAVAAGTTQGTATALTATSTKVTGADGTKGVILNDVPGHQVIWNNSGGGNILKVYPPSGANVGNAGTDVAVTLADGVAQVYWRVTSTKWGTNSIGVIV